MSQKKCLSNAEKRSFCSLFALEKLLDVFKVRRSSHLLLALVSEEKSTTFPLWKLDYNKKIRGYIKHNMAVWFFKASKTMTQSLEAGQSLFIEPTSLESVIHEQILRLPNFTLKEMLPLPFGFEKQSLIGLFWGHHMSQSTYRLVEWFWQQAPLVLYLLAQL